VPPAISLDEKNTRATAEQTCTAGTASDPLCKELWDTQTNLTCSPGEKVRKLLLFYRENYTLLSLKLYRGKVSESNVLKESAQGQRKVERGQDLSLSWKGPSPGRTNRRGRLSGQLAVETADPSGVRGPRAACFGL